MSLVRAILPFVALMIALMLFFLPPSSYTSINDALHIDPMLLQDIIAVIVIVLGIAGAIFNYHTADEFNMSLVAILSGIGYFVAQWMHVSLFS